MSLLASLSDAERQAKIKATMRRFDRLFERRPDPRGHRSTWREQLWIAQAYLDGLLSVHAFRIPVVFSQAAAMTWQLDGKHGESAEHQLMKHAAWVWAAGEGAKDARLEVYGVYGFRPDIWSRDAKWIIECGNTPIEKVRQAAFDPKPARFTLIPHQAAASYVYSNGYKDIGLLAFDIRWSDALRVQMQEDEIREVMSQPVLNVRGYRPVPTPSSSHEVPA